jgi:putative transposase
MKRTKHSVAEIMRLLRQAECGKAVADICKDTNISEQTLYRWKRKYGGLAASRIILNASSQR